MSNIVLSSESQDKYRMLMQLVRKIDSCNQDLRTQEVCILQVACVLVPCSVANLVLVNLLDDSLHFVLSFSKDTSSKDATSKDKTQQAQKMQIDDTEDLAKYAQEHFFDIAVEKRSVAGWVKEHREVALLNDVQKDFRFFKDAPDMTRSGDETKSILAVPICSNDVCFAVIELVNKKDDSGGAKKFVLQDIELITLLCQQAGVSLLNANLLKNARQNFCFLKDALQDVCAGQKKDIPFVAQSPSMKSIFGIAKNIAKTSSPILLSGEKGTGKKLLALQIHLESERCERGERKDAHFVCVNCAALQDEKTNIFLGQMQDEPIDVSSFFAKRLEKANGGTLFLQEVSYLPFAEQQALLKVLQEKQFQDPKSGKMHSIDVRVIASSSKRLEHSVDEGLFLQDLFFRLNVLPIYILPLRKRKEDIMPLLEFFLAKFSFETTKHFQGFSKEAAAQLLSYSWPGNVGELENAIQRACILGKDKYIQKQDLRLENIGFGTLPEDFAKEQQATSQDLSLHSAINRFKRTYILETLRKTGYNQTKTAKLLDIQRTYVSKLMHDLDIL